MITDLEPDILECEVKWALESITMNKASGGDGIPVELFQPTVVIIFFILAIPVDVEWNLTVILICIFPIAGMMLSIFACAVSTALNLCPVHLTCLTFHPG